MYNYYETIQKIEDLDWHLMVDAVQQEIRAAERNAYSGKPGCVKHREMGAPEYASKLKALASFLGNCVIPAGASESEVIIYKNITEKLVAKKQLKPEALNVFGA